MNIALFAIIGTAINAGAAYWICFAVLCFFKFISLVIDLVG